MADVLAAGSPRWDMMLDSGWRLFFELAEHRSIGWVGGQSLFLRCNRFLPNLFVLFSLHCPRSVF